MARFSRSRRSRRSFASQAPQARVVEIGEAGALARRRGNLADQVHRAEAGGQVPPHHLGGLAVDLQVLEAVWILAHAEGMVAVGGLEVAVPQVGRLEDVPVRVDRAVVGKAVEHAARIVEAAA